MNELAQCLKLRPNDSEALALAGGVETAFGRPVSQTPTNAGASAEPAPDPLERIVRTFDAAAFRQAAQMLDQVDAAKWLHCRHRNRRGNSQHRPRDTWTAD